MKAGLSEKQYNKIICRKFYEKKQKLEGLCDLGYSPLVSVIVAIYNIEPYIRRCVDSVLAQDYQQLEIILVDDGSTDQCPAICDAYAQKDTRIKVIHKQNGGLSDARNAGLNVATGEYIGYVDGDDWIEPGMYGSMVRSCVEQQAQIAVCRYNRYLEKPADGTEKQDALNQSGMQNEKNAEKISIPGKFCAIDSMLEFYLRDSGLIGQWNENRIFQVWDHCSKAAKYTLSKSYVAGTLYVSLSSSVVRNQLYFQLDIIKKEMNLALAADRQFWMKPVDLTKNLCYPVMIILDAAHTTDYVAAPIGTS